MYATVFALLLCQPPQAPTLPPFQAPMTGERPEQAPPMPDEQKLYDAALLKSQSEGLPFVLSVNCPRRDIKGSVSGYRISVNGNDKPRIIVVLPGSLDGVTFPPTATDAEIRSRWEVSRAAVPFDGSNTVRPDGKVQGPWVPQQEQDRLRLMWPKDLDFPEGLRFYRKTRLSQRIAVTNERPSLHWYDRDQDDNWANAPPSLNPNRQHPYATSGGMDGVTGWESNAAVVLPASPAIHFGPIPIANGGLIPGYTWAYPDGTRFFDMLSRDGVVFELREREKADGVWSSRVLYRDPSARPEGYHGKLTKSCLECHQDAGDSQQYGILVRGNDTVFSFLPSEIQ